MNDRKISQSHCKSGRKINKVLIVRPFIEHIYSHLYAGNQISAVIIWDKYSIEKYNNSLIDSIPSLVKIYEIKSPWFSIRKIISILSETNCDVILVNGLNDLIPIKIATYISKRQFPLIIGMSHNPNTWKSKIKSKIAIELIRYCTDGIMPVSNLHSQTLLEAGIPQSRVRFIPNACQLPEEFNTLKVEPYFGKNITFVANIEPRKGQLILIKSLELIKRSFPDINCSLIGRVLDDNYQLILENEIKNRNLESNTEFLGWLDNREVLKMILKCDIFVFPTFSEMMPRAISEAMWLGKPIVATRVDGIIDLIENNYNGILVEPGNCEQLAQAIMLLLADTNLASLYANRGKEFIRNNCSYQRVGSLYNSFYDQLRVMRKAK